MKFQLFALLALAALAATVVQAAPVEGDDSDKQVSTGTSRLIESLREALQTTVKRIKVRVDEHHQNAKDLIVRAGEIRERLRQLHADAGPKVRDLVSSYSGKVRELVDKILNRLRDGPEKREVLDTEEEVVMVRERRQALDNLREMLRDLHAEGTDRFKSFAEWLKGAWDKATSKARDHHERLIAVAKEVRDHAKEMHKETVREAVEALRPHREELGNIWREVLDAARNALRRRGNAN